MNISIEISSGLIADKSIGTLTLTNAESFVRPDSLRLGFPVNAPNVMTMEHNQAILDGSLEEFPDNPLDYEWGYWSSVISGSDGQFTTRPIINRTWTAAQSSDGITLVPYDIEQDFARRVSVTWYNNIGGVISSANFDLDADGIIEKSVANFYRVSIEFISTNIPLRRIRLKRIEYGTIFIGRDEHIGNCNIIEEAPESSDMVASGALEFTIKVQSSRLRRIISVIKEGALLPMRITGDSSPYGVYFLDKSEDVNGDGSEFKISAKSGLGAMENTRYMGDIYTNRNSRTLMQEIFNSAFKHNEIALLLPDTNINVPTVTGHIPIGNARDALQMICLAIGARIECTRNGDIKISMPITGPQQARTIYLDEIYQDSKMTQIAQYTGVDVIGYTYILSNEQTTVISTAMGLGDYTFEFQEPLGNLSITGASILTRSANYATIRVAAVGTVTLRGYRYTKLSQTYSIRSVAADTTRPNICVFDKCTLLSYQAAQSIAYHLWEDVSRSAIYDDRIIVKDTKCSDYVSLERINTHSTIARIERLEMNLRGIDGKIRTLGEASPAIMVGGSTSFGATGTGQFGNIQTFVAPVTGTYTISAAGAKGGENTQLSTSRAGLGAYIRATFKLTAGQTIDIIVGQKGLRTGGSFEGQDYFIREQYAPHGGGGYTAAFLRTQDGQYSRHGVRFECLLMAAGGGGIGEFMLLGDGWETSLNGEPGDASTIYSPSNPRYPDLTEHFDPEVITPTERNNSGAGIYQYINWGGAGAKIVGFTRPTQYGIATIPSISQHALGGFGGGGAGAIGVRRPVVLNWGPMHMQTGGGGWVHTRIAQPGGYDKYRAHSWCSGTVLQGVSGYNNGDGFMLIEWMPD